MQVFLHQVWVLTAAELRELLWRRRSLLSLVLYCLIILLSVGLLFKVQGTLGSGQGHINLDSPQYSALAAALDKLGLRETFTIMLRLSDLPPVLWIFQMFSLLWFPTLVALVSCDAIALDVYRGTLRYLLLRSSRSAYYTAKMVSHFVLYTVLQALSLAVILAYSFSSSPHGKAESLALAIKYFIVFLPFLWCVLAATLFMSSFARRPMNALIRIHVLWVAFIFIVAVKPWASPLWSRLVLGLFVPFDDYPINTLVGYTMWAALFSVLGLLIFKRRDV